MEGCRPILDRTTVVRALVGAGRMYFRWSSSCRTNTGIRRKINEDAYLEDTNLGLWLVADGMGGHANGDVASRTIVESLADLEPPNSIDEFAFAVKDRFNHADRLIKKLASLGGADHVMGSTVVALLAFEGRCLCIWAGDSRAYIMRDGRLTQVTRDHSVVEDMIEGGELRREHAASHPLANRITRAIGAGDELVLDEWLNDLQDGDTVFLCSDGLNREVNDEEIAYVLASEDCAAASDRLIGLTLERGARDNVTVAVIRFEHDDTSPESDPTVRRSLDA